MRRRGVAVPAVVIGTSKSSTRAFQRLKDLGASIREYRLRLDAKRMGCSYVTRKAMETRSIEITNAKPWAALPSTTKRAFDRAVANLKPRRQRLSTDERRQLATLLGFSIR